MSTLPEPGAEARASSQALQATIAEAIHQQQGFIPFSRYMEAALYTPGLGYYSAGATKLGAAGDFITAPELTPLFADTLANQAAQVLVATHGDLIEVGAGSGRLAHDLLRALDAIGQLPGHYYILEVSGELRQRQEQLLHTLPAHLAGRVEWLDQLPDRVNGLILGNEVLDAMPVELVAWHVGLDDAGHFAWRERPLPTGPLKDQAEALIPLLAEGIPGGYISEIHLAAQGFMASLADRLAHGVILLIDYGFGAGEYYHPQRAGGTVMCHYRQQAHADPFFLPGLQDITAHVNFSAIYQAATRHGLHLLGYTNQADFLINCGITDVLSQVSPESVDYLKLAAQAQKLLSPAEMGELFKVIAFGRGIDTPLLGFSRGDKSRFL
jgi:SAM-dependent MidA family methyltransferase